VLRQLSTGLRSEPAKSSPRLPILVFYYQHFYPNSLAQCYISVGDLECFLFSCRLFCTFLRSETLLRCRRSVMLPLYCWIAGAANYLSFVQLQDDVTLADFVLWKFSNLFMSFPPPPPPFDAHSICSVFSVLLFECTRSVNNVQNLSFAVLFSCMCYLHWFLMYFYLLDTIHTTVLTYIKVVYPIVVVLLWHYFLCVSGFICSYRITVLLLLLHRPTYFAL
jgi:hypothetical protein